MAERPILLFGQPRKSDKTKPFGGGSKLNLPSHARQVQRLGPVMSALQTAVARLSDSPSGLESEKTLVFKVKEDVESFFTAVKHFGTDMEWILDVQEEIETDDDFYALKDDGKTRNENVTTITGKLYCVLSNARAMDEMLHLWDSYSKDKNTKFPRGKTGLKHIFDRLEDIHFWSYKERIEETGILDIWREDLKNPTLGNVKCEFELVFRLSKAKREEAQQQLIEDLESLGGQVLSSSVIPEISYHGVLASIPRGVAEDIINGNRTYSIVIADQIMFFRPVGQAVIIPEEMFSDVELNIPSPGDINEEPIIALFDGLPQENHPLLKERLIVDDPENYAKDYEVRNRKHGTSMASIIIFGDINHINHVSNHKLYVRPIMRPVRKIEGFGEEIPEDILLVDKIHIAVRRLFEDNEGKVAPSIKVINLSFGITYRQFDRLMSPLARLLDWLSYKYGVLFVVSAGNHLENIKTGMPFDDFSKANLETRDEAIIRHIFKESRNLRLLSPAESVSALTVGSTFEDFYNLSKDPRLVMPCSDGLPSAFSSVGMGKNNAVKPDILFPGGRSGIGDDFSKGIGSNEIAWKNFPTRGPGIASIAPQGAMGKATLMMYTFGTSNSAALISHEASRCYDSLLEVFQNSGEVIPQAQIALLIKAMLIHGAQWGELTDKYANTLGLRTRKERSTKLHRFLGYGKPVIDRVIECTKHRVSLVGYGSLKIGEAVEYDLPLPFDLSSKIHRRLTTTLTYFPPFVSSTHKYRGVQLWFSIENRIKKLLDNRLDIDSKATQRGSVQHEIFEDDSAVVWDEDQAISIKINCRGDADKKFALPVPFAVMVSFEMKDTVDIDVYSKIAQRITTRVKI